MPDRCVYKNKSAIQIYLRIPLNDFILLTYVVQVNNKNNLPLKSLSRVLLLYY